METIMIGSNSTQDAHDGLFEACWRVYVSFDGGETDEVITVNAIGFDGMLKSIRAKGYNISNIMHYTAC
jgi:hypothetical protein